MCIRDSRKIVNLQIDLLKARVVEQGWTMNVSPAACDAIADEGFDPAYGARPLKRVIQQRIANPLATELLKQNGAGQGEIQIDFGERGFSIQLN